MKLRQVVQEASVKDETLYLRIKARPAVTAWRRKFNEPQNIISKGVKLIAKWVKREIPLSHSARQRWKIEAAGLTKPVLSSEASSTACEKDQGKLTAMPSAISEAQIKLICVFRVHRFGSHPPAPCRCLWCSIEHPWTLMFRHWTGLSPRAPLTKMGARTPKFRCRCHCLELNLDPVMCYQWLSVNCSVIKGYMLVT